LTPISNKARVGVKNCGGINVRIIGEMGRWDCLRELDDSNDMRFGETNKVTDDEPLGLQRNESILNNSKNKNKTKTRGKDIPKSEGRKQTKNSGKKVMQNKGQGKLKCFYANVRSIVNKRDELELYMFEESPDIIGITETWATDNIEDSELSLDGYVMLRRDRVVGVKLKGGGVLLYVKNSLDVVIRDDIADDKFPECIWCDVKFNGEKTLVGLCYRAPDSSKIEDEGLYRLITRASKEKLLLMGDINFPELDWGKPETIDDSHPLVQCVNDNFLIQCVENCTRGKNILDLVFTSEENMVENLVVGEPFGTSDHQIVRWVFIASKDKLKHKEELKVHDYFKVDYNQMKINSIIGNNLAKDFSGVEENWICFRSEMDNLKDKWVPHKINRVGKCKWVNKKVNRCRRAKVRAWGKLQSQDSASN
jgi:hypothetical protein